MILLRRLSSWLIVMAALANLNGCGSPTDAIGGRASHELRVSRKGLPPFSSVDLSSISKGAPHAEPQAPASVLEIVNVPSKAFSQDEASDILNLSFEDLNLKEILGIEEVTEGDIKRFPDWLKSLNGQKVRICGYMFPTYEDTRITQFLMHHSPRLTNFGAPIRVYELLHVELAAGATTNFVGTRSMEVIGVFRIDPSPEDGRIQILYFLDDAVIVAGEAGNTRE